MSLLTRCFDRRAPSLPRSLAIVIRTAVRVASGVGDYYLLSGVGGAQPRSCPIAGVTIGPRPVACVAVGAVRIAIAAIGVAVAPIGVTVAIAPVRVAVGTIGIAIGAVRIAIAAIWVAVAPIGVPIPVAAIPIGVTITPIGIAIAIATVGIAVRIALRVDNRGHGKEEGGGRQGASQQCGAHSSTPFRGAGLPKPGPLEGPAACTAGSQNGRPVAARAFGWSHYTRPPLRVPRGLPLSKPGAAHWFCLAVATLLLEAARAVDRLVAARAEGDLRHPTTARASDCVYRALGARAALGVVAAAPLALACGPALGAAAGLVGETFLGVELLLALGESERAAAVAAGEGLIGVLHERPPEANMVQGGLS